MEMEFDPNETSPEELGEEIAQRMEAEEIRNAGGGGRRSRKGGGFGLDKKGRKVQEKLAAEAGESNKEKLAAKRDISEHLLRLIKKETNPALHKGVRQYFEWVRYGTMALAEEGQESEIVDEQDLKWKFVKAGGKGGENVNKRNTAASVEHLPTKLSLKNKEKREQFQNQEEARKLMFEKLRAHLGKWKLVAGTDSIEETMARMLKEAIEERKLEPGEGEVLEDIMKNLRLRANL